MAMTIPENNLKHYSKFLSLVLRHHPELIGLELNAGGWADVATLILKMQEAGKPFTPNLLTTLVATNAKQRFAFSDDGTKIRASQGHSVTVDLGLVPQQPPQILYHGTGAQNRDAILADGLKKGTRQHVHLSTHKDTATQVGSRYGRPLIINVFSRQMFTDGFTFYLSENGVWLTEQVPAKYLAL
jgi:putative RNA 2'-phosphotransferase